MNLSPPAAQDMAPVGICSASQNQSPVLGQRGKQRKLFIVSGCGSFT